MNLRKYNRYSVDLPVFLFPDGFTQQQPFGMGKVSDLSTSGCKIESQAATNIGMALALRFHCPHIHERFLIHHARIAWTMGNDFGVEFLSMQQGQLDRLKQFISALSTTSIPEVTGLS